MVAIEHRQKASSSTTTTATITATINATVLSPTSSSTSSSSTSTSTTTTSSVHQPKQIKDNDSKMSSSLQQQKQQKSLEETGDAVAVTAAAGAISKSAVSQRNVDIKIAKKSNKDAATKELTKKVLKLDLTGKQLDEYSLKSPKSPITARLPHQTSLTSSVDMEDRKSLRGALYNGIFNRHRRTIFAFGSFLRMLRSRNSQYNTIRSSSEGEHNRSSTRTLNEHDTKPDIDTDESSQEVLQQKIQQSSALSEKE